MNARALPQLALRPMLPTDAPLLAEIFRAAIEELPPRTTVKRSRRRGPRPPTTRKNSAENLPAN